MGNMGTVQKMCLQELRDFASEVRRRRQARNISQTKLGALVGCSVKQINNIERAVNWPSMPIYLGLCRELGFKSPMVARVDV